LLEGAHLAASKSRWIFSNSTGLGSKATGLQRFRISSFISAIINKVLATIYAIFYIQLRDLFYYLYRS
jgi:hypothetical protein